MGDGRDATLKWRVPWARHKQKTWQELRTVFTPGAMALIVALSVAVAVAIWCWVDHRYGDIEFEWVKSVALSLLGGLVVLIFASLTSFIPPTIMVSPRGISNGHGLFPYRNLASATVTSGTAPELVVHLRTRTLEYAIPPEVDLDALEKLLEQRMGEKSNEAESR